MRSPQHGEQREQKWLTGWPTRQSASTKHSTCCAFSTLICVPSDFAVTLPRAASGFTWLSASAMAVATSDSDAFSAGW